MGLISAKVGSQVGQQGRSLGHPSGKDINIALRVKGRQGQIDQNSTQGRDKTGLS